EQHRVRRAADQFPQPHRHLPGDHRPRRPPRGPARGLGLQGERGADLLHAAARPDRGPGDEPVRQRLHQRPGAAVPDGILGRAQAADRPRDGGERRLTMATATSTAPSPVGDFTAEAFEAHLKTQASAPAWWLERKRKAYERFAALPLPRRTDEAWRFSNLGGIRLDGFTAERALPKLVPPAPYESQGAEFGGSLSFMGNQALGRIPVGADLAKRGVIIGTLQEALRQHADLLKAHFMAQPQ